MVMAIITLQAGENHSKTLKDLNITLEIISLKEWEKITNVVPEGTMETEKYCQKLGSPKKSRQELEEYILNSTIIDPNASGKYGIWQCDYVGKIKVWNKVWDFWSVSGLTRLSRKVDASHNPINENFEMYCHEGECYETIYLVCNSNACSPIATEADGV